MPRDLLIALAISLLLHAGLALGFARKAPTPPAPPPPPTIAITLPPLDPDEPPPADSTGESAPADLAPPSQPDVPSLRLDSPFVQALQPVLPTAATRPTTLITIPAGRPGGGNGLGKIFDLAELDQRPEVLVKVPPVYPYEMRQARLTGEVVVGFTVDTEGNVRDARILTSTQREFEQPALQAVQRWKFKPGKKAGRAVPANFTLPISFTLVGDN